ncbi:PIN domain-containing protein [Nocardia testacea]|uniref:PIN domain-containing protein n=1 Tax=Nocardia testacea TaxID=248551 RepID=UPI00031225A2|nr:PIN domain-containing protein [Nocardia testacea]
MLVLDTNVISAAMAPEKHPIVAGWLAAQTGYYTTSITVLEVANGLARLAEGRKRSILEAAALTVFEPLEAAGRVLPFEQAAGYLYAGLMVKRPKPTAGEIFDAQILAIALTHDATVVTQNVKDFAGRGAAIFNPATGTDH